MANTLKKENKKYKMRAYIKALKKKRKAEDDRPNIVPNATPPGGA